MKNSSECSFVSIFYQIILKGSDLGRLNIHETDTERKRVSFFGNRTEMGRRSRSLSAKFNTFSDVRVRTQGRYQKHQFDMSFQHCSFDRPQYGKAFLPRICSFFLYQTSAGNLIQNKPTNNSFFNCFEFNDKINEGIFEI